MTTSVKRPSLTNSRFQLEGKEITSKRKRQDRAKSLANSSKRLDLCAAEISNYFFLSGISDKYIVRDKDCLELGSGWVLSHSLVFYLLGARKIFATDIEPLFDISCVADAVRSSIPYIVRDSLAGFEDHDIVRTRLNRLLEYDQFTFELLQEIGIEYLSPIDFARESIRPKVDFIFSKSVLEHVPVGDIAPLLENLVEGLKDGGLMFHLIHLEDHVDINSDPFRFLSESAEVFSSNVVQSNRGNRLRGSQWKELFSHLEKLEYNVAFEWSRKDKELPSKIDPSIAYTDATDLRVSHLGIVGRRVGALVLPKTQVSGPQDS